MEIVGLAVLGFFVLLAATVVAATRSAKAH